VLHKMFKNIYTSSHEKGRGKEEKRGGYHLRVPDSLASLYAG
jgi:hypothetical protein